MPSTWSRSRGFWPAMRLSGFRWLDWLVGWLLVGSGDAGHGVVQKGGTQHERRAVVVWRAVVVVGALQVARAQAQRQVLLIQGGRQPLEDRLGVDDDEQRVVPLAGQPA